jgi:hypothetical protein
MGNGGWQRSAVLAGVALLAGWAVGGPGAGCAPRGEPEPDAEPADAVLDRLVDKSQDFALFDDDAWMALVRDLTASPVAAFNQARERVARHRDMRADGLPDCATLTADAGPVPGAPAGTARTWTLDLGPPGGGCRDPDDRYDADGRVVVTAVSRDGADGLTAPLAHLSAVTVRYDRDRRTRRTDGTASRSVWLHGTLAYRVADPVNGRVRIDVNHLRGDFTRDTDPDDPRAGFRLDAWRCAIEAEGQGFDAPEAPYTVDGTCDYGQLFLTLPPDAREVTRDGLSTCRRAEDGAVTCPDLDLAGLDGEAARVRVALSVRPDGCGAWPRIEGAIRLEPPHPDRFDTVTFAWSADTPCGFVDVSRDGGPAVRRPRFIPLPPPDLPLGLPLDLPLDLP